MQALPICPPEVIKECQEKDARRQYVDTIGDVSPSGAKGEYDLGTWRVFLPELTPELAQKFDDGHFLGCTQWSIAPSVAYISFTCPRFLAMAVARGVKKYFGFTCPMIYEIDAIKVLTF
jgi:hypothetical protein